MRLTIAGKSALIVSLLVAFSLALVGVYLESREHAAVRDQVLARLEAQASLLTSEIPAGSPDWIRWAQQARQRTGARVTVVAADGTVLGDSNELPSRMENHARRPEIAAALAEGTGHALRYSETLRRDLLYFARRVPLASGQPVILRLAVPISAVRDAFRRFHRDFLLIAMLSLAVASGIAILWARRVAGRLRQMGDFARGVPQGKFAPPLPKGPRDEIGILADALNAMATDLAHTLERLEQEGRRSRSILENMAEGLMLLDGRGRISLINPAAHTLLGIPHKDATLGRTALEVVRSNELDDLLHAAAQTERGASGEITLIHPRRRILAGTAVTIRDTAGAQQGTVLVLRDITELKRLEEIRMEFVLNVSHELRTPLTAIRGYAETLLDGGLVQGEEARKFLQIIHRHVERLGRLLNDLLDLSDIELERTPLHIRPVPLAEVVHQVTAMLASLAEQKAVKLGTRIPPDLPPVLADRDRLTQILVNLVDNAVKFTPEGGSVTVHATLREPVSDVAIPPGHAVEIVVDDTGVGIPRKDLPRITERFYRVDKARSRELGGTGLGLAIVKHLVESHHGSLNIESEPGRGTRVRVTLPAGPVSSAAGETRQH
jgi:two-component system phosphate regulon sensor histidine kinase PhoR